jgi:hypothetical protein
MHSDWFNGIEILQGRWQNGEKVGYCYPSGLEETVYKWDVYVPLVTKGLTEDINRRTAAKFVQPLLHDDHRQIGISMYKGLQDRVRRS